jgi:hypothetical protein
MTTYTPILNAEVDAESPITDLLLTRLRDNPLAIAAGDVDAPRIQFAGLDAWFSTAGAVGTYVFARRVGDTNFGGTVAGSGLTPTSAACSLTEGGGSNTVTLNTGSALSGTWRCMGTFDQLNNNGSLAIFGATLWLRIS